MELNDWEVLGSALQERGSDSEASESEAEASNLGAAASVTDSGGEEEEKEEEEDGEGSADAAAEEPASTAAAADVDPDAGALSATPSEGRLADEAGGATEEGGGLDLADIDEEMLVEEMVRQLQEAEDIDAAHAGQDADFLRPEAASPRAPPSANVDDQVDESPSSSPPKLPNLSSAVAFACLLVGSFAGFGAGVAVAGARAGKDALAANLVVQPESSAPNCKPWEKQGAKAARLYVKSETLLFESAMAISDTLLNQFTPDLISQLGQTEQDAYYSGALSSEMLGRWGTMKPKNRRQLFAGLLETLQLTVASVTTLVADLDHQLERSRSEVTSLEAATHKKITQMTDELEFCGGLLEDIHTSCKYQVSSQANDAKTKCTVEVNEAHASCDAHLSSQNQSFSRQLEAIDAKWYDDMVSTVELWQDHVDMLNRRLANGETKAAKGVDDLRECEAALTASEVLNEALAKENERLKADVREDEATSASPKARKPPAPLALLASRGGASAKVYDFEHDMGAISDDGTEKTAWHNGGLMNQSLGMLGKGDTLIIPNKTFHVMGGIHGFNLDSVTIRLDGTLSIMTDHSCDDDDDEEAEATSHQSNASSASSFSTPSAAAHDLAKLSSSALKTARSASRAMSVAAVTAAAWSTEIIAASVDTVTKIIPDSVDLGGVSLRQLGALPCSIKRELLTIIQQIDDISRTQRQPRAQPRPPEIKKFLEILKGVVNAIPTTNGESCDAATMPQANASSPSTKFPAAAPGKQRKRQRQMGSALLDASAISRSISTPVSRSW